MKIQKVHINKFKVIENLEAEIAGKNILLMGDNGVGKSSFIQFLEIALGKTSNIPKEAEGKGYVVADKEGKSYTFKVKVKDGKSVVEVECDGMKDTRKSAIAGLVGAIDFDIDEFVQWSETKPGQKKQVDFFKTLLPEEVIDELNRHTHNLKKVEEERTEVGKQVKNYKGFIAEHPMRNKPLITAEVDVKALEEEQAAIIAKNHKIQEVKQCIEVRKESIQAHLMEIEALKKKIKELTAQTEELTTKNTDAEKWLAENPEKSVTEINQKLTEAQQSNANVKMAIDYQNKTKYLKDAEEQYGELSAQIDSTRQAIADAIRDMDSPVPGLTFDDERLVYNGVPVSIHNMSSSEIIELGVKMKMAENPDLGVLFIQRGESIGKKRFEEILKLCSENNWQLVMEQVERGNEKLTVQFIGEEVALQNDTRAV
jgi:energy-coupling factor transporter ATP-binding protein EcfA2